MKARVRGECVEIDGRYFVGGEQDGEDQRLVELRGRQLEQATIDPIVRRVIEVQDGEGRARIGRVHAFQADLPLLPGRHPGGLLTGVIQSAE